MACPVTKTLQIAFTPPSPAPTNGYRIKYRVVGTSTYTTAVGPFTSSPVSILNVPSCENVEGTIESICGAAYSTVASFTASKETTYVCNDLVNGTSSSTSFIIYPKKVYDLNGSNDAVTLTWDASGVPNRFNVYNSEKVLIFSTGWKGVANYSGPWGSSLNTPTSGSNSFSKNASGGDKRWYYITTEHAGSATNSDSWSASLQCTYPVSTFSITPSVTSVNEGGTVTFTVTTTNIVNGTTLYYSLAGISGADLNDNATAGQFTITNNTGTFSKTLTNDTVTEGTESFTASVRINSAIGEVKATSVAVSVADTSSGAGGGGGTTSYSVTPSTTTVNEGSSVVFSVVTTNVIEGTTLYYTIGGDIQEADFTDNAKSGSFIINNNAGSFTKTLSNDVTTEGTQTFDVQIRTTGIGGNTVGYCGPITVSDTSTTGGVVTPTYTLVAQNASSEAITTINEGNNLTIRLNTTDVVNGTTVPYVVTGIAAGDVAGNSDAFSGNFTINNNTATKNFYIEADQVTEGNETFTITLTGKGVSKSVTINDTSIAPSFTGYTLTPVLDDPYCQANGEPITAYKNNSGGSILAGDTLYAGQSTATGLTSGTYSDGSFKYTVQAGGSVSSKVACQSPSAPTYDLVARVGGNIVTSINEGQTVVFSLVTENVPNGTSVAWTMSGINSADLSAGTLSGTFVVGSNTTASFTLANDFTTEGTETMTMSLPNNGVTESVTIGDQSQTPTMYYQLIGCTSAAVGYTTTTPDLGTGQRYVLPGSTPVFYTYSGSSSTFSLPPNDYNGSIQKTSFTGCPA